MAANNCLLFFMGQEKGTINCLIRYYIWNRRKEQKQSSIHISSLEVYVCILVLFYNLFGIQAQLNNMLVLLLAHASETSWFLHFIHYKCGNKCESEIHHAFYILASERVDGDKMLLQLLLHNRFYKYKCTIYQKFRKIVPVKIFQRLSIINPIK